jgi:hypothetical protein
MENSNAENTNQAGRQTNAVNKERPRNLRREGNAMSLMKEEKANDRN